MEFHAGLWICCLHESERFLLDYKILWMVLIDSKGTLPGDSWEWSNTRLLQIKELPEVSSSGKVIKCLWFQEESEKLFRWLSGVNMLVRTCFQILCEKFGIQRNNIWINSRQTLSTLSGNSHDLELLDTESIWIQVVTLCAEHIFAPLSSEIS